MKGNYEIIKSYTPWILMFKVDISKILLKKREQYELSAKSM